MVADIIIIAVVALLFGVSLRKVIREMKNGKCDGCGGSCMGNCSSCKDSCRRNEK